MLSVTELTAVTSAVSRNQSTFLSNLVEELECSRSVDIFTVV